MGHRQGARAHHAEGGRAAALRHSTPDTQEAHTKTTMYRLHGELFLSKLSILTYIDRQPANNLQRLPISRNLFMRAHPCRQICKLAAESRVMDELSCH